MVAFQHSFPVNETVFFSDDKVTIFEFPIFTLKINNILFCVFFSLLPIEIVSHD